MNKESSVWVNMQTVETLTYRYFFIEITPERMIRGKDVSTIKANGGLH